MREFYALELGGGGHRRHGAMQWFLELLEELGVECRVGHPLRSVRRDGTETRSTGCACCWTAADEGSLPEIWMPSTEQRDLRTLLRDDTSG